MPHAERNGELIEVYTQWNERELIKQVPGVLWHTTQKVWTVPLSWTACVMLRGVFTDTLTIGEELRAWAHVEKTHIDYLMDLRQRTEPTWTPHVDGLYPFQEIGREFLTAGAEVILADEMGTGKTIQTLAALSLLSDGLPALVICPNAVKPHWQAETLKWCKNATPYIVRGGAVTRRKIITDAARDPTALIIVNTEAVRLLSRLAPYGSVRLRRCRECDRAHGEENLRASLCHVHPKELNKIAFKTVIIDEAHRIKTPKSLQTRAVWAVAHQPSVRYRWALTGTPLANHPGDLWSILHTISPRDFPTKGNFVDRYCLMAWNGYGGLDIIGLNPANLDEFYNIVDFRFRRMPKELVLPQLPPKIRSTRWVDLTPTQSRMYRELERGIGTWTSNGTIVPKNSLVLKTRQMQIASSTITLTVDDTNQESIDDWQVELCEPSTKLDELVELLTTSLSDKQVTVCAQSRRLIDLAAQRLIKLNVSYGRYTGAESEYERDLTLRKFQAGEIRVLLFTLQAGGVGVTMTAADTMIFLQRSWSMVDNRQAEDRIHRIGAERHTSVHIIDIIARDTVEESQIAKLYTKFKRLQEIARDRLTLDRALANTLDDEEAQIMNSEL